MGHGTPDWASLKRTGPVFAVQDLIDAAIRASGQFTFDRRGNVVFYYDMHNGLGAFHYAGSGANNDVYPIAWPALHGGLALALEPGVAVDNKSWVWLETHKPPVSAWGLECHFVPSNLLGNFELWVAYDDKLTKRYFWGKYVHTEGKLYVRDKALGYVEIGDPGVLADGYTPWHVLKVVGDAETHKYVRVILDDHVYLCDEYDAHEAASLGVSMLELTVRVSRGVAGEFNVPIDDFILTINEPI